MAFKLFAAFACLTLVTALYTPFHEWRTANIDIPSSDSQIQKRQTTVSFPAFNFTQPLDHFTDTGFTFPQRFWVSNRHYVPGGPVIVLDGGETSGTARLPFLDTGIVDILAQATGGLGMVLEHRYYGTSLPVANFSTDSLRWLTNAQAAADSARFMSSIQFASLPGLNVSGDLTAPGTPWIYYGGSYAGARAAHMKVLYPHLLWGSIASSGVVHANLNNWGYFEIIRQSIPANCSAQLVKMTKEVDALLENPNTNDAVKTLFGAKGLTLDADLVSIFTNFYGSWQNNNWDPAVGSDAFTGWCETLGNPSDEMVQTSVPGLNVSTATANWVSIVAPSITRCTASNTADNCIGTLNTTGLATTRISSGRAWDFQVCTQWGFFTAAPPNPMQESIVSKFVTVDYSADFCQFAYPPGEFLTIPPRPRIEEVNELGGFGISAERLAIVDGQDDPWRFDCAHSFEASPRVSTAQRPFELIPNAVHHYDENGLADHSAEPPAIQDIHAKEVEFVKGWLAEFKAGKR